MENIVSLMNKTDRDLWLLLIDHTTRTWTVFPPLEKNCLHGVHKKLLEDGILVLVDSKTEAERVASELRL